LGFIVQLVVKGKTKSEKTKNERGKRKGTEERGKG